MVDYERMGVWAGIVVPFLTLGTMLMATAVSPTFSWTANALSNLGADTDVATPLTMALFNGGLIVGGLVSVAFGYALDRGRENFVERLGAITFVLAILAMVGVGVFPQDRALHFPMAAGFYLLSIITLWVYGTGNLLAGARVRGAVTILLGIVHVCVWILWVRTPFLSDGIAVPEFIGAVLFSVWTVATARWHLEGDRAIDPNNPS